MVIKQILKSGNEPYDSHRTDFETCPECQFSQGEYWWDEHAHTLILEPRFLRNGAVTVITTCPKCDHDSWVHHPAENIGLSTCPWPKEWRVTCANQHQEFLFNALREWALSACGRCIHLKTATVFTNTYKTCKIGNGPTCQNRMPRFPRF